MEQTPCEAPTEPAEVMVAEPPARSTRVRAGQRVLVNTDSAMARWIGALALLGVLIWQIGAPIVDHHGNRHAAGRWALSLTIVATVALVARGVFLGRPVITAHAAAAVTAVLTGLGAHLVSMPLLGDLCIAAAGLIVMWPSTAAPQPQMLPRVWALVNATSGDPLAPFAMQSRKSYHFSAAETAAIAYRTRIGYAVVSGDPIGDETRFAPLVADFAAMCHSRGWRIIVLGCSRKRLGLWADPSVIGQSMRPIRWVATW